MHFSHISIGGGITGLETIISAFTNIQRQLKKSKKIIFAIIDKNPENIPGGVAYGFKISQFGYFNNPIRLSPVQFTKWLIKKENKKKIISYLKIHGGYTGKDWIKKNINILYSSKIKQINELYIPRTIANFWMEQRLLWLISKMKKISKKNSIIFDLKFFKGEVLAIKNLKDNYHKIIFKNNYCEMLQYKIVKNSFKKIVFEKNKQISEPIFSKTQNIGLGLPPPKQLATTRAQKNNYYIWDFYSQGSTSDLINKILQINKIKKK